jgi:hypothetical protein
VVSHRPALAAGAVVVALYVLGAAWSGNLSPLARRPLFDALGPLQPYRWVAPPPQLASTNVAPSSIHTTVKVGPGGSKAVPGIVSSDSQITVILVAGLIPPHGSDTSVRLDIVPLDPSTLRPLADGLSAFGNVYRISGTYLPSKASVTAVKHHLDVVLVYPVTASLFARRHEMQYAPVGGAWRARRSTELVSNQQVEALVPGMGDVVVGGKAGPVPVTTSPTTGGGGTTNTVAIGLMVAAGAALLVGLGLLLRNRRG